MNTKVVALAYICIGLGLSIFIVLGMILVNRNSELETQQYMNCTLDKQGSLVLVKTRHGGHIEKCVKLEELKWTCTKTAVLTKQDIEAKKTPTVQHLKELDDILVKITEAAKDGKFFISISTSLSTEPLIDLLEAKGFLVSVGYAHYFPKTWS